MLSPVSSVSFHAGKFKTNFGNEESKLSNMMQTSNQEADSFDRSEEDGFDKYKTAKIVGGIGALALATWIGLGIAVGRKGSTWKKAVALEGEKLTTKEKINNFFYAIGDSANSAYKKIFKRKEAAKTEDIKTETPAE